MPHGVNLSDGARGEEVGGVGEVSILLGALGKDRRTLLGSLGWTVACGGERAGFCELAGVVGTDWSSGTVQEVMLVLMREH